MQVEVTAVSYSRDDSLRLVFRQGPHAAPRADTSTWAGKCDYDCCCDCVLSKRAVLRPVPEDGFLGLLVTLPGNSSLSVHPNQECIGDTCFSIISLQKKNPYRNGLIGREAGRHGNGGVGTFGLEGQKILEFSEDLETESL